MAHIVSSIRPLIIRHSGTLSIINFVFFIELYEIGFTGALNPDGSFDIPIDPKPERVAKPDKEFTDDRCINERS